MPLPILKTRDLLIALALIPATTPSIAHAFSDFGPTPPPARQATRDPNATFINKLNNSMRQRAALTRFHQHVSPRAMDQSTLSGVLSAVEDGTGLRLHVDWPTFNAAGINGDTPIRIQGRALSYEQYLTAACTQAGITMLLYFKEPDGTFELTTPDDSTTAADIPPQAMPTQLAAPRQPISLDSPADQAILKRLEQNIPAISADKQRLEKAIDALRESTHTNIQVNWTALQAAGVDRDTPVTINLHDLPFRKALATLLHDAGPAANLSYLVEDGVITLSTRDDLDSARYQEVRIFNIQPLTGREQNSAQYDERIKDLVDTIKTTVAAESWRDAGGNIGTLRVLNTSLIVNQTHDNQRAIAQLLQALITAQHDHRLLVK